MASIVPLYELRVGSRTYLVPLSSLQNSTNDSGGGKGKKKKQKNSSNNSAATAAVTAAATATTAATTEEAPLVYIQQPHQQIIQQQIAQPQQHQPVTIQTIPHHQEVNNEVSIVQHHVEPTASFAVNQHGEIQLHHIPAATAAATAPVVDAVAATGGEVPGGTKYPLVKARCPYCPRIFDYGAKLKKHAFEAHGKDATDPKIQRNTREVKHSCQLCGHSVVRFYQHICRHLSSRHRNECGISKYLERFYRHIEMEDAAMGGTGGVVVPATATTTTGVVQSVAAAQQQQQVQPGRIIVSNGGLTATVVSSEPEMIVPEMMTHHVVTSAAGTTVAVTAANCMQLSDDPVLSNTISAAAPGDDATEVIQASSASAVSATATSEAGGVRMVSNAMSAEPVVISEASSIEISTEPAEVKIE